VSDAYTQRLEEQLAELSDWATILAENERLRGLAEDGPLHAQLKAERHRQGLSQRALSALTDRRVHQATVCGVEQGSPDVHIRSVLKMADALGCDVVLVPREES
jgi:hypothetical protein